MLPGWAPLYRAAAACPNSWKPPESTDTAKTSSSSVGRSKASYADAASPRSKNTHATTATKTTKTTTAITGRNSTRKGSVSR